MRRHGLHAARAWNDGYDFWAGAVLGIADRGFSELDVRIDSGDGIVRDVLGDDDAVRAFFRGVGGVNRDAHLYGELVDVPERAFLVCLGTPYGGPYLCGSERGQVLGPCRRFERFVRPALLKSARSRSWCWSGALPAAVSNMARDFGIERRAECGVDGDVAEHVLDVIEHPFAGAGVGGETVRPVMRVM